MLVASPRNHRYLQREVSGFRGPLALYGGAEHRRQVSLQFDSEFALGWRHDDGVDEPSECLRGLRAGLRTLQGLSQGRHLLAVQLGHVGMKKRRRRVGCVELSLQLASASVEGLYFDLLRGVNYFRRRVASNQNVTNIG